MSSTADDWVRPRPGPAGYRRDTIVAAALVLAALGSAALSVQAADRTPAPWWGMLIWAVAIAAPLAVRRRWPEPVALVVAAAFVIGQYASVWEVLFSNICLFLALYSVGAWGRNRMLAKVVRVVIVIGMLLWLVGALIFQALHPELAPDVSHEGFPSQFLAIGLISIITNLLYFGAAYVFGNSAWTAARQREALEQRTHELEREREVSSRQAVTLERVRIARELHDVVAHHVSVMGVQAGAARRVLAKKEGAAETDPRVVESLSVIESNAREAVDELHRMLGALRQGDDPLTPADDASRSASTRGIAQLDELVGEARASGLPVTYSAIGEPQAVPAVVGLNVYRIAQEALTNVRKHGGPRATADVRLRYLDEVVEIEVSDSGVGGASAAPVRSPESAGPTMGLGHIGMRERAAAVGGEIEIGPKPRGGFLVRARLPLAPSPAAPSPPMSAVVGGAS
ncbi:sensor histidine kinase [Herbiconiux sp. CPCC 205763]|uniref:histidine kinase n=1 Tax=Herbiconiux aconitum TaxID=2970913 RepID=A0ABT2GM49_9MICO|nr:sensor histidine kinase [Herbiconiux aconitum]MCS5717307.1 sensor histidine kinase [Herbiconiux aconitum]